MANVARHSLAREVSVAVAVAEDHVLVRVADPGPPKPATSERGSGRGLTGIAERAAIFGGVMRSGSVATGGFAVEVVLPREKAS